jgi:hypothetical protein
VKQELRFASPSPKRARLTGPGASAIALQHVPIVVELERDPLCVLAHAHLADSIALQQEEMQRQVRQQQAAVYRMLETTRS